MFYHWEKAAIGGHPVARYNLAYIEEKNGSIERSVKHFTIAANLGHDKSMKALWKHYSAGHISKGDLDATLRSHQAAIDETKSAQRDEAEEEEKLKARLHAAIDAMKSSDRDAGEIALKELGFLS